MKYCRYCGKSESDDDARFCEACGKEFSQPSNTSDKIVVTTKEELRRLIEKTIRAKGSDCDLNFIDVSNINDMSNLFWPHLNFNGDIRQYETTSANVNSWIYRVNCRCF